MKTKIKHSAKPSRVKLLKICKDARFKAKVKQIRINRGIKTLIKLPDERRELLVSLSKALSEERRYQDDKNSQVYKKRPLTEEMKDLCDDFGLPQEAWFLIFSIVLCIDPDNVRKEDFENIGMHPSLARIDTLYGLEKRKRHHLYLDVTFATVEDVREIWNRVLKWQETELPRLIAEGKLPDLLEDMKAGRPPISDYICLECARLKDEEGWTSVQIGKHFGFPLQENAYGKRTQCRTAQVAVKRGRELRRMNLHT